MKKHLHFLRISIILQVFQKIAWAQREDCTVLEIPHLKDAALSIPDNDYVNVTFWLNVSGCRQTNAVYKMLVKVKTNTGLLEEAGTLIVTNDTCSVLVMESLFCISTSGPAQLYRRINRSHLEIQWAWIWKDGETVKGQIKRVNLNISYPASVTSLTVEDQEVKGHYIINKSKQVNVVCSFDKGNPPALVTFRLLDKNGRDLDNVTRKENKLIHSLAAGHCEQPWPVVRCEAQGSSENRSVTFLVRCPLQFTDMPPKYIDPEKDDHVTFNIEGHSTEIASCFLTPESLGDNFSIAVSCRLDGNPPDLCLTIHLAKNDTLLRGNWTLAVSNEIGIGNTTVIFDKSWGSASETPVSDDTVCSSETTL